MKTRIKCLSTIFWMIGAFSCGIALRSRAQAQAPAGLPLKVAIRPMYNDLVSFLGNGMRHITYEMEVTNLTQTTVTILSVQVSPFAGEQSFAPRFFTGSILAGLFSSIKGNYTMPQTPVLDPAQTAVLFLNLDLEAAAPVPTLLKTSIQVQAENDKSTSQIIIGVPARISAAEPVVVSPPLRGNNWWTPNGPSNYSIHRRTIIALDGAISITEKYAEDWVRLGRNGATFEGDSSSNASYFAYRQNVVAAADGKIISILEDVPENVPNQPPAIPLTVQTIGGNHIVQQIGDSRYAFYAHLIPGSIRVRPGEWVQRGQILAQLGNSGNSSQPHLHFHVMDGPDPLGPQPLPFALQQWTRSRPSFTCHPFRAGCSPLDGPTDIIWGPGQAVLGEAFMSEDAGDFRRPSKVQ